ncbi:MAG: AraC family transcriptional regulator [Chitinophagaceae bacterium]|nr:AraC family transcriptional regulator [Chitinophagaceae bacterium]
MNNTIQKVFDKEEMNLFLIKNDSTHNSIADACITKKTTHFYFVLNGKGKLHFGERYTKDIVTQHTYFFYEPNDDMHFTMNLMPQTTIILLSMPLEQLHKLITMDTHVPFILYTENKNEKHYEEKKISPDLLVCLHQVLLPHISENVINLFYHGKIYEIMSFYFIHTTNEESRCPFLNNQSHLKKITAAKEYLIKNAFNPPNLSTLALIVGTNTSQLKNGFKQMYGISISDYLFHYKFNQAKILLDTEKYTVQEVANKVGYENVSHFIDKFKKKFGITPKKYLISKYVNQQTNVNTTP